MIAGAGRIITVVLISLIIFSGVAVVFVRPYWLRFRKLGRRFNYRITDIWASMLGIAPSIIAATIFMKNAGSHIFYSRDDILSLLAIIGLTVCQIAGLAVGRIDIELASSRRPAECTAFESGVSIVTGALLGLAVFCFGFPVLGIFIEALGLI